MRIGVESIKYALLRSSGVIVFLLLWEAAPRFGWLDPQFAPPLSAVLRAAIQLAAGGELQTHMLISLWRAVSGLLCAAALGIPAGFILGLRLPEWAVILDPFLRVLSQVNPFSLMPVFILCFGLGERAKIMIIAWVSLWPILFYTITAVRNVDPLLLKTARALGISTGGLCGKVILPAALPVIFVGLRIGAGLVFMMIVAAEMLGANAGLGWLVHNSAANYQVPRIFAGATFIVLLGYLLNRLLLAQERQLFTLQQGPLKETEKRQSCNGFRWPVWSRAVVAAVLTLLFLVAGGHEVYLINSRGVSLSGHRRHGEKSGPAAGHAPYSCPMHAFVSRNTPGVCPICAMDLVGKSDRSAANSAQ